IVDGILVQVMAFDEELGIELEFQHGGSSLWSFFGINNNSSILKLIFLYIGLKNMLKHIIDGSVIFVRKNTYLVI
ncbi:MAG: hypothetical protein IJW85_02740, partial [Clostridia bacterium]|nr:hypothetical protein [Clostridia bacterium]